jgi:hypothetical protein
VTEEIGRDYCAPWCALRTRQSYTLRWV